MIGWRETLLVIGSKGSLPDDDWLKGKPLWSAAALPGRSGSSQPRLHFVPTRQALGRRLSRAKPCGVEPGASSPSTRDPQGDLQPLTTGLPGPTTVLAAGLMRGRSGRHLPPPGRARRWCSSPQWFRPAKVGPGRGYVVGSAGWAAPGSRVLSTPDHSGQRLK